MCRARRWWIAGVIAAGAAVGSPRPVLGQTADEYRARVQALVPLWRAEGRAYLARDSANAIRLPQDTVRVGPLTILADSSLDALARESASRAAIVLEARFGKEADALRGHVFVLTTAPAEMGIERVVGIAELDEAGRQVAAESQYGTVRAVAQAWWRRGANVETHRLDPEFQHWLGTSLPVDSATRDTWIGARISVVTSGHRVADRCFDGNMTSCALALGITGREDPAMRWFDAAERRAAVRAARYRLRSNRERQYDACVTDGNGTACDSLMELIPANEIAPPLGSSVQQSVVRVAMDLGGPDAMARMLAAPSGPEAQLGAASRVPTDSLLRAWRARVIAARPDNATISAGLAAVAMAWVAACGALALLGSSRWR